MNIHHNKTAAKIRSSALSFSLPILLLITSACQVQAPTPATFTSAPKPQSSPLPSEKPTSTSSHSQEMDAAKLAEILEAAEELNLHSLLIMQHGEIISETYYPPYTAETRHELYSVTKSFMATLVGIAVDKDLLTIDDLVMDFFPDHTFANLDERKQSMRVEDLLTMTSGLDWSEGDPTYRAMYMSADWVQYVLDLPMLKDPGSQFIYCSGCSHILSAIVQTVSNQNGRDFARENLFTPLSIEFDWDVDSQGIPIGGWGLQLTPRDMAKLGHLYLHKGMWDGQQIVSSQWMEVATQKQIDNGDGGYGYQWWLKPDLGGYSALGRYGQTIFVQSELDLVVVTTAQMDGHEPIFELIEEHIIPAVK